MFTQSFIEQLGGQVEKLEEASAVELVVVVGQSSGNYREIDHQTGFVTAIAVLMVAIYSPWEFIPEILVLWLVLGYGLGMLLSWKVSGIRRLFTSSARRHFQARLCAQGAFVQKRMSSTRDRTGLLLYISEFERVAVIMPDTGIEAKVPRALFNDLESRWAKSGDRSELEAEVLKGLDDLVKPLGSALPRREDDENELPNEICFMAGGLA